MVMRWPADPAPPPTDVVELCSVGRGVRNGGGTCRCWAAHPDRRRHRLRERLGAGSIIACGTRCAGRLDRLLVIDPKGGMEFGRGQKLFTGFAHDNGDTLGYCGPSRR